MSVCVSKILAGNVGVGVEVRVRGHRVRLDKWIAAPLWSRVCV